MNAKSRHLLTADDRRADIITAAMAAFAKSGYFGANTTEIAKAAGISQAYLYRLYSNKEALFVATISAAKEHLVRRLDRIVDDAPDGESIGRTLMRVATSPMPPATRDVARVMIHASAASHVDAVGSAVRSCFRTQIDHLKGLGALDEDIRAYFAWSQYTNGLGAAGITTNSDDPRDRVLVPPIP